MKHFDFMLLDVVVLQVCFTLSYWAYIGFTNPYQFEVYQYQAIVLTVSQLAVIAFTDNYHGILRRKRFEEFVAVLRFSVFVLVVAVLYLFIVHDSALASRMQFGLTLVFYLVIDYVVRQLNKWRVLRFSKRQRKSMVLITSAGLVESAMKQLKGDVSFREYFISSIILLDEEPVASGASASAAPVDSTSVSAAPVDSTSASADPVSLGAAPVGEGSAASPAGGPSASSAPAAPASLGTPSVGEGSAASPASGAEPVASAAPSAIPDFGVPVSYLSQKSVEGLSHTWVDEAFILQPDDMTLPSRFLGDLVEMGITVNYAPSAMADDRWPVTGVRNLSGYKVLTGGIRFMSAGQLFVKRLMDIAGGLVGCILTCIIFVFVAPAIYVKSPGPIFFTQERVGRNGKVFKMYKFRSMYLDAEERKAELMKQNKMSGFMFKVDDDPRVIGSEKKRANGKPGGIGNFIRRTSLDEFPQFFNVLKGDMSLVGTRPPTIDEWERYGLGHRVRLTVKPGITGLWQVSGRSQITDFEDVVRLDREYIESCSIALDVIILVKTVVVVFKRKGAE